MPAGSKIFIPCRGLGYVSNHIPLQVRYIKSRRENLIVTCVGKSFHTYGISHFGLLSVGSLHHSDITCITSDTYHVYTSCDHVIYAWRRGTELKHTYRGHERNIRHMLPFGVHLISIDEGSTVRVWDIKDECLFLELTFNNDQFEISTVLHPSTYVNKILFGSEQGQMQLWNLKSARLIYSFNGWGVGITCLEQAPALDVIAIGLADGRIILQNIKYDETVLEFMQDWGSITSISFRADGTPIMATGSTIGHIVFWDLEGKKVHSQLLSAHDGPVTGLVCLPNEPLLITSSPDNTLKLWVFDMTDGGARLLRIREGHAATPNYVRFHGANGHNILSSSGDSTIRIYNTQTELFNKSLGKASYNRKASKKRGRVAKLNDPLKMPAVVEFTSETTREKEWDNIAAIHSGLAMVTTWSYDKKKMGDLKLLPDRLHKKKNTNHDVKVVATCISITHCGNFVIIGYSSGHVDRFNIQSGLIRDSYGTPSAHSASIRGVVTDSLNQKVITGCGDGHIKFWQFKNAAVPNYHRLDVGEPIQFFRAHQESSMLAVALEDCSVAIVDIDTHHIVRQFCGHTAQLNDASFSPDSRWLVTASMDCSIRTWDIPSAQLVDQFRTETACTSLSMSPTGETLATSHVDYLGIFLWTNRSLYVRMTLQALDATEEPLLVVLPECRVDNNLEEVNFVANSEEFVSREQIHVELLTLSGLSTSRWRNLLDIDVIKRRNKPTVQLTAAKHAPFFLPTVSGLSFQFDLNSKTNDASNNAKLITTRNISEFGKLVEATTSTNDFSPVVDKLKNLGPSGIDFEIKSLSPEGGCSVNVMLQFMKCVVWMLQSNRDFELAQAYLGVFLKSHGDVIATEYSLRGFIPNLQSCLSIGWNRIQEKLMYNICIVEHLKST